MPGFDNLKLKSGFRLRPILLGGILLTLVIGAISFFSFQSIERLIKNKLHQTLHTVLSVTQDALDIWAKERKKGLSAIVASDEVSRLTAELLKLPPSRTSLLASSAASELRAYLKPEMDRHKYAGFFIIGPDYISLASMRDENVGAKNLLIRQKSFFPRIFNGETLISLPMISDVSLPGPDGEMQTDAATMFVGAPVYNEFNKVIAVLTFRIDPEENFAKSTQLGRIGKTGETYLFNREGKLVSESRFDKQLIQIGLIPNGKRGILNIEIRDPGVNLAEGSTSPTPRKDQPLTLMAEQAIKGFSGFNLEGYRDYRGVPVVGAWTWNKKLDMGITTEIDVSEAYESLFYIKKLIIFLFLSSVFLFVIFIGNFYKMGKEEIRAKEKIQMSENMLKQVLDTIPVSVFWKDKDFNYLGGNIRAAKDAGLMRPEEIIGKNDLSLFRGENAEKYREDDRLIFQSAVQKINYLERLTRADGAPLWRRTSKFPLKDTEGKIYGILGISEDVTERKLAEDELHKLSQAVEQSSAAVVITDTEGNMEYVNPKFVQATGYSKEELIGQNPRILKSGEFPPERYRKLWETIKAGKEWHGEFHNKRKDGKLFWEFASISPIKNADGQITHFLAIKEDITEKKGMEKKLQRYANNLENMVTERTGELHSALATVDEARNRTDAILNSIGDGLIVTDNENHVVLMNKAAEYIFGASVKNALGQPIEIIIKDETLRGQLLSSFEEKELGSNYDFELPMEKLGKSIIYQAGTSVVLDKDGIKAGVVTIIHDVTQERKVGKAKTEFISTAAHELRTPLTSIRGFSELLMIKKDLSPEEKTELLAHINEEAVHLSDIISDLLDISIIESGQGVFLNKVSCCAKDILRKVISTYQKQSGKHRFEEVWPEDGAPWFVDQLKVEQVLKNIYSNAVKYSPGGGLIQTKLEVSNSMVKVLIKDEGIGMTPEQLDKVFEKFYRADSSDTAIEGTGLGMSIIKHLVEAHGGEVWVKSEYGKGTTIIFTVPGQRINKEGKNPV